MLRRLLTAFVLCCLAAAAGRAQDSPAPPSQRELPQVSVREQAGAPLRLTATSKWATPSPDERMFEVYFLVANEGGPTVRAYAVRVVADWLPETDGCFFRNIDKRGKLLAPRKSHGTSTWRPAPSTGARGSVEVSLDFVEFEDGTVWGEDTCQAAELFAGSRAGAREARAALNLILQTEGTEALLERVQTGRLDLEPPAERPAVWAKAFRGGVSAVLERLRRANEDGGPPEVEEALRKPFDAADDN